jgi:pimeloyl-ACP methyl ester carboxylesterase
MVRWLVGGLLALIGLVALLLVGAYLVFNRPDIPYSALESSYAGPASRFADLPGGLRMHYRDQGNPNGPVLILVHGYGSSLHTWEPWVERLGETYRIISLDLPGHGLTRAPAGYNASMQAFVSEVRALTNQLQLGRFAIAGSSMGGNVAWEYALAHPEQVESLTLVAASGWPETDQSEEGDPLVFKILRNPLVGPLMRNIDSTALTRQGLQAAFYDPALATEDMVRRYVDLSRAPGHRDILLQLTLGSGERNFATAERLAPLANMPVLILQGDTDRLVPPAHAEQFHNAILGSQLVVFEATGHLPQEERADESAQTAREFLFATIEGSALATAAQ